MRFDMLHPADQLIMIMDRIYHRGMTTTSGGNLSIIDENGDIWITPTGIDKGSLNRRDIMQIKPDGQMIGLHRPSVELPFHQNIYRIRPDIKAIVHAHPPGLVAFSLARKLPDTMLVPNALFICGPVTYAAYEVPGSELLGERISAEFARGINSVMMENHGAVVGGSSLFDAFMRFETLEKCAQLELDALKVGVPRPLSQEQIERAGADALPKMDEFVPYSHSSEERAARRDMCTFIHRAYDQKLFSSTQGTLSQRLSDGSILITPYRMDRMYIEPEDIVRVKDNMCEAGKRPSRAVVLHTEIYRHHPDIGSVIIAHPPSIMAFSVTDAVFDSRTIPESYIMLRDVKRIAFEDSYLNIDKVVGQLSMRTPVMIIENSGVIVAGNTLLNAFDRLEVAEYSAKSIIAAKELGGVVMIGDDEVRQIEHDFHLE